jgi:RND family efflux transporter MFP subunit
MRRGFLMGSPVFAIRALGAGSGRHASPSAMKTMLSLFLPLALLTGCAKNAPAVVGAPAPIVVRAAPVTYSSAAIPIQVTGVLARRTEAALSFKIGGVLERIDVRAGDAVAKDQVLARLQPDEIEAQVTQARSAAEKARRDLARTERLQAGSVATLENLQDARTALEQAEAQLRSAEFNRLHSVIRAPAAGRILRRSAEPSELVAPGRPILDFASDADGWIVRCGLADRDVARLRLGDPAELGVGGGLATGRVTQIADAADAVTRTTEVEIAVDGVPASARSGFITPVTMLPGAVPERPVVPAGALVEGDAGGASLYLLAPGATTVKRLVVEVEALVGPQAYLRTELPHDARVVTTGAEYLRDGATVAIVP